ncbi:MAG: hypothetical protein F7B59_01620 [Desulfurococcales archaeon]|nr:hypothetical protein [Desulfurococcales archaeon]
MSSRPRYMNIGKLSPREIITFSRLIETYSILYGLEGKMEGTDLNLLCRSLGVCSGPAMELRRAVNPEAIIEESLSTLGLHYGDRFRRRDIYNAHDYRKAVTSFLFLKRLGVIQETKSGLHRVLDKKETQSLVKQFKDNKASLEEVIGKSKAGWGRDDLLMEAEVKSDPSPYLSFLSSKRLLDILSARVRKKDWETVSKVVRELNSRINRLSNREITRLAREVENNPRIANSQLIGNLLKRKPSLRNRLAKSQIEPRTIRNHNECTQTSNGYSRSMGGSQSFSHYLRRYLETGNPGYLDMALSSVKEEDDYPLYARLVRYIEAEGESVHAKMIGLAYRLLYPETDMIPRIIAGKRVKRRLISFLRDRILLEAKAGKKKISRKIYTDSRSGGRLDIRRSSFRLARFHNRPLIYRRNVRKHGAVLVVDTSGSLSKFSGEVIFYSSLFSRLVENLVVFSEESHVFKCREKCSIDSILDKLSFGGNTDLVNVLEAAVGLSRSYRKIIVISDLKHNVSSRYMLVKKVGEILAMQRKIVFILVGDYDKKNSIVLSDIGARVVLPGNIRELKRILYRELLSH